MTRTRNPISGLPSGGESVTPHDTNNLTKDGTVYIGGDGDCKVLTVDGDTLTFAGLSAGDIVPVKVRRLYSLQIPRQPTFWHYGDIFRMEEQLSHAGFWLRKHW